MEIIKPKAFSCYLDNYTILEHLNDEQAGKLWKMLFEFALNDKKPVSIENPLVNMAFDIMSNKIKSDFEKYAKKVENNRLNGKRGGAPKGNNNAEKQPKTTERLQEQPNGTQNNRTGTETSQYKDKDKDKDKDKNKDKDKDKDNNISKEILESKSLSANADVRSAFDYQKVINSFNLICTNLPQVQKLTDKRRKQIKNACNFLGNITFEELFEKVQKSDFLSGRNNKWGGCSFDWIFNQTNLTKIIEGNYDNKTAAPIYTVVRNYDEEF